MVSSSPVTIDSLNLKATQTTDEPEDLVQVWLYDLAEIPEDFDQLDPAFGCFVATELTAPAEGSVTVPMDEVPADMKNFQNGVVILFEKHSNTGTVTITTS